MLAVAMNGKPLPIEHGFPVRTIVPGLYGYVSATKWVVDYEVTRFSDVVGVLDPARLVGGGSGQDRVAHRRTPLRGRRRRGEVNVGGLAWAQHTGIDSVEVAVDGGEWQRAQLAETPDATTPGCSGRSP